MLAWGWNAWTEIVRGVRNVSGRLFNALDYREGTVWSYAKSWVRAHLIRWVLERLNILMIYLMYLCEINESNRL